MYGESMESMEKLLSWSLVVTDLENLKMFADAWYERSINHANFFTFTKQGDFFLSNRLSFVPIIEWHYLVSILGASCVGFIIECDEENNHHVIRLWRLENGSLSTCSKKITSWKDAKDLVAKLEKQLAKTGRGYTFQRNWKGDEVKIFSRKPEKDSIDDDCVFTDEKPDFYEAKLHLELLQPEREKAGDFSRYRLK
ncbi:MAG: hypothetical protein ACXAEU_12260 [Candidatus Hodarchaeales archaeon]|jgi:hypothetical protein